MQPFIQALPLTALIDALRGVINEGLPFARSGARSRSSRPGAIPFALALRLFRWQ